MALKSPSIRPREVPVKYCVVTGGVCSSLGKGVTTSSIGAILRSHGVRVTSIKIDPYINIDAGLMSPFEHGEVFVLNDGGEADLDLGNYERWMGVQLRRDHNITTGKVYDTLIRKERKGEYLGKTVQMVPHFTEEVIRRIRTNAAIPVDSTGLPPQVCLIELGGTVGDMESAPFIEALRQLRFGLPADDFCLMHVSYLPSMGGCQKTKPTQHSVRTLLSVGMTPDFIVLRSTEPLDADARSKVMTQCGIQSQNVIGAHNVESLYAVPVEFERQSLFEKLSLKLNLGSLPKLPPLSGTPRIENFAEMDRILRSLKTSISIAFVGKYVKDGMDAYFSVMASFEHCSIHTGMKINFFWLDSEYLEGKDKDWATEQLLKCQGIFVAGGFGSRGVKGKVEAIRIARTNKIPFFGVCLGMQLSLVEHAQNVLGLADATSEEFDTKKESKNHIIKFMPEVDPTTMGANMRLGGRPVSITDTNSRAFSIYKCPSDGKILERHRHRYEFNMDYYEVFQQKTQMKFVGADIPAYNADTRVEIVELPESEHPFFFAVQFHPEFRTFPTEPSPPYLAFVKAVGQYAKVAINTPMLKAAAAGTMRDSMSAFPENLTPLAGTPNSTSPSTL